jgi:hypothetical protein
MRLDSGVGYRLTGASDLLAYELRGVSGSVGLQFGDPSPAGPGTRAQRAFTALAPRPAHNVRCTMFALEHASSRQEAR